MARSRSQRMTIVLQLANRSEQAAALALQKSRSALDQADSQLQQIKQYQQEYVAELNAKTQKLTAQTMINDRHFLQRLSEIEITQCQQIAQLKKNESGCLSQWKLCYQRRQSIETLIARLQKEESSVVEKQLQKELDELSVLMSAYRQE